MPSNDSLTFEEAIRRWLDPAVIRALDGEATVAQVMTDLGKDLLRLQRTYQRSACLTLWVWEPGAESPLVGGVVRVADYQPGTPITFTLSQPQEHYFQQARRPIRFDVCLVAPGGRWHEYQENAVVLSSAAVTFKRSEWLSPTGSPPTRPATLTIRGG